MNVTTATATFDAPAATTTRSRLPLLRAGALSGVAAAVATEVVAAVARISDVSMKAGSVGADSAESIPVLGFAIATLLWTAVGIVMAAAMGRWATHPARTFTITTVALTAVSLVPPALAGATTAGTKLILAMTHVVAALIIVPALRHELSNRAGR